MPLSFDKSFGEVEYRKSIEKMKIEFKHKRIELEEIAKTKIRIELNFEGKNLSSLNEKQHQKFEQVFTVLSGKMNAFLYGPAGSGKSYIAQQVAETIKVPYYAISVCYQTSISTLMGYMDANGKYIRSLLREAYENGGVFCIDEIDAGNQNVIMCLNAITNNETVAFPDKMVKKHKDFICVATANTAGTGNDLQYVGRERIDASTLSRFVKLKIDYDLDLEKSLIDKSEHKDAIIEFILKKRRNVNRDSNNLFTPRQTVFAAKLAETMGLDEALKVIEGEL